MDAAVIGVGYWGKNIVRNLLRCSEVQNLYVYDSDPRILQAARQVFPEVREAAGLEEILAKPSIEAVFVVTPPESHFEISRRVLQSGRHLYVEKPFVTSTRDALELMETAEKKKLTLMSGLTFLYSPPVRLIKEIIDRGDIGEIAYISFRRINLGIHQRSVNVLWDLLPHDLSMIRHWLGPGVKLAAGQSFLKTSVGRLPDIGFVFLEFSNGTVAEGLVSWLSPRKTRETIIVGRKKMIVYNDSEPEEKIKIYDKKVEELEPGDFGEYQLSYRVGDVISPRVDASEPLLLMVRDFFAAVREGRQPLSNAAFALEVTANIEMILANASQAESDKEYR